MPYTPFGYNDVDAVTSSKEDEWEGLINGPRMRALDLDMEADGLLLDVEARPHARWSICGCSCSKLARVLFPASCQKSPEYWYRLSHQQRQLIIYSGWGLLALLVGLLVLLATRAGPIESRTGVAMSASSSRYCSWNDLYLPEVVRPEQYTVNLKTTMREPFLVEGSVRIKVAASEHTPCVVLHAYGLNMASVEMLVPGGGRGQQGDSLRVVPGKVHKSTPKHQQLVLLFPEALPLGPLQPMLQLNFTYTLQEGLDGFYKSTYTDAENVTRVMASTQFESLAARKAFPCFDEPTMKASFTLKLTVPREPYVVLSNMPVSHTHDHSLSTSSNGENGHEDAQPGDQLEEEGGGGHEGSHSKLITYHFLETPVMSSYLLAWVVGDLISVHKDCKTLGGKIRVAVWGTNDRASQLNAALGAGCNSVQAMEKLLQVPYPLPKLDLVGVPNFAAGAMENWGLLMYRESRLLVDDTADDIKQKYSIATIIAHETAHQWFGDLVTTDDWTELWLNEGFATYFENIAADSFHPHYHYFNQFFSDVTTVGLEADALASSHPLSIQRPMRDLAEADAWFDEVEYQKGGAVLRMVRAWLNRDGGPLELLGEQNLGAAGYVQRLRSSRRRSRHLATAGHSTGLNQSTMKLLSGVPAPNQPDVFLSGLSIYLKEHRLGNVNASTLWRTLEAATGQPLEEWMAAWTYRKGFPIVMVSLDEPLGDHGGVKGAAAGANQIVYISQAPFPEAPSSSVGGLAADWPSSCNDDVAAAASERSWWIPLSYTAKGAPAPTWLDFRACNATLPTHLPSNGWVLVNTGRYGFFRVNYSLSLWTALTAASHNRGHVSEVDFAGLMDDAYALARVLQLNITVFMDLAMALGTRAAPEYSPWKIALGWLRRMEDVLDTAAIYDSQDWLQCSKDLKVFVTSKITGPFIANLSVPGQTEPGLNFNVGTDEPVALRLTRPWVLESAGALGHASVVKEAVDIVKSGKAPHPDVASAVYKLAVSGGDVAVYDAIQQMYEQATDATHKSKLLHALARAPSPALIQRTLLYSLSPAVRSQDLAALMVSVGKGGGLGFNKTWGFIMEHADEIKARYPGGDTTYSLGRKLLDLVKLMTDEGLVARLLAFDASQPGILPPSFAAAASEAQRTNTKWLSFQGRALCSLIAN